MHKTAPKAPPLGTVAASGPLAGSKKKPASGPLAATIGRGRPALLWALLAAAVAALAASSARAQPTLLVTDSPETPTETRWDYVPLRPNLEQTVYLWVHNPGKQAVKVVVALRDGADRDIRGMHTTPFVVKPDGTERVVFPGAAPAPAAPPPAAPAAGQPAPPAAPAGEPLKGPPFNHKFVLLDADSGKPLGPDTPVQLLQPRDYLDEPKGFFDGNTHLLQITVKAAAKFGGPPARVELVLPPDRIPGLRPDAAKEGAYQRELIRPGDSVQLSAENLQFDESRPANQQNGLVYLTVDGCPHAFTFLATFRLAGRNDLRQERRPVVGIHYDRYAPPMPRYPVGLTVDNVPLGAVVEVGLKRDRGSQFARDELRPLPGSREQHVTVRPDPEGGAIFVTAVRDWATTLDSAGMYGEHRIRVSLRENNQSVPVLDADDLLVPDARPAPALSRSVTFDDTPPDITSLGVILTKTDKGKPVEFEATSQTRADNWLPPGKPLRLIARGNDPESGIRDVVFFLGKPTGPELKIPDPMQAVEGKRDAGSDTTWRAELPAPTEKPAVLVVSAQFTNRAGVKSFGTVEIRLLPPPAAGAPGAPPKPSIEGTVYDAAGRAQPRQKVTLTDAQNVARDTVETDAAGKYLFKDVAAGSYRVTASKSGNNTYGEKAVQVVEGEKRTGVDLTLRAR